MADGTEPAAGGTAEPRQAPTPQWALKPAPKPAASPPAPVSARPLPRAASTAGAGTSAPGGHQPRPRPRPVQPTEHGRPTQRDQPPHDAEPTRRSAAPGDEHADKPGRSPRRLSRSLLVRVAVVAVLGVVALILLRKHLLLVPVVVLLLAYAASLSRRDLIRFAILATVIAAAAIALRVYVVQPYYIPSESMEPTLHGCMGCNNDHVLVDKLSYHMHDVNAGDIVVFHRPPGDRSPDGVLIKRVVALGGDFVQLQQGRVLVNGSQTSEPYINKACGPQPTEPLTSVSKWRVPVKDVFVMGDNRCNSHDSRAFGPIKVSSIVGRAFVIVWPFTRITSL